MIENFSYRTENNYSDALSEADKYYSNAGAPYNSILNNDSIVLVDIEIFETVIGLRNRVIQNCYNNYNGHSYM